jgi:hypothetical protein
MVWCIEISKHAGTEMDNVNIFADLDQDSVLNDIIQTEPDLSVQLKKEHEITVHVKCPGDVHNLLKAECERTGLSMPHILREYAIDFMRIRNEALLTAHDAVMNGQGSIIHNMLLGFEQRLIKTVEFFESDILQIKRDVASLSQLSEAMEKIAQAQEQQAESIKKLVHKIERNNKALDLFVLSYYLHTPQIPDEFKDGHTAAGISRHKAWSDKVASAMEVDY